MLLAMEENELQTTVYTMEFDSLHQQFEFLVSTSETPYWRHEYLDFPDILLKNYRVGGVIPPYEDENGVWLSAFAPVRDNHGSVIAIVQIDAQFDHFIQEARSRIIINLLVSLLIMGIVAGIMIYVLRKIGQSKDKIDQERMELDILKKELIANVSHDLRTPLASIQGYLETLLLMNDKLSPEKKERYLQISLNSAEKLRVLVDELFELSILESRNRKLKLELINTSEFLHDTAITFKHQATEKQINFLFDIPQNLPPLKAEPPLFDRLLQNVIGNALKYCNSGNTVEFKANAANGKIHLVVKDDGPGINAEDLPHIFDRFRRGNPEKPGTGLGLAIVKSILDLHQAEYALESEAGKGTTFRMSFNV
jgi:signal transduction histidine kinase